MGCYPRKRLSQQCWCRSQRSCWKGWYQGMAHSQWSRCQRSPRRHQHPSEPSSECYIHLVAEGRRPLPGHQQLVCRLANQVARTNHHRRQSNHHRWWYQSHEQRGPDQGRIRCKGVHNQRIRLGGKQSCIEHCHRHLRRSHQVNRMVQREMCCRECHGLARRRSWPHQPRWQYQPQERCQRHWMVRRL